MTASREMTAQRISEDFYKILEACGYVHDASYNLADKPEVARAFGKAFHDYMVASIFDTDWEGYPDLDLQGVAAMMRDFRTAIEHGLLE